MRRIRWWTSILLSVVLLAAAAVPNVAAAPGSSAQQHNWGSCEPMLGDVSDIPSARCTMVAVPLDANNPAAGNADIAVIRIPATGARIGALFVNPGGPGASAVDTAVAMAGALDDTAITEHFDLVGFDPRGVGYSTPEARCRTDAEFDAWRRDPMVDYSPAGVAHIERMFQQLANQCVQRMGTPLMASVGTASVARDMDVVRQAIGDDRINYLGFSYGTSIGRAYLRDFGQHVRAMVLDGAIDPTVDPVEKSIRQMAGFQTAFEDYAADCARYRDCPLGQDPGQWVNRYHQLVNPLVNKPGRTSDPRGLSYSDAITGTINALYTERYWIYLTSGLLGLKDGDDADDLLLLADDYQGRDADGHYNNQQDAFNAVRCVDAPVPSDPAVWVEADRRVRQVAPFLAYGEFTGYAPRDICSFWPVPPTSFPGPASPAAPGQVVVVSTTHDPATPYQAGVDLARQLGAPLVSFEGTQHTVVFNGDDCVDTAITRFLVDGVVPRDLHC